MSESDSFINEVTEEVRRDRFYMMLRRYGWIAIVAVLALVGGAAWNEWTKAQATARAEATGDAILDALSANAPEERIAALSTVEVEGGAAAVLSFLTATEQQAAGDIEAARATLDALAVNAEVPQDYRSLASFKSLMLGAGVMDEDLRRAGLEALAVPGNPYRMLALEQLALAEVSAGETEAALARLSAMIADAEASDALRERASGLIVALGGEISPDPAAE